MENFATEPDKIIKYLKDNLDYKKSINNYIVYFLFHTGLRYGELVGLTWSDIEFENGFLKTYRRYNTNINKFVPSKTETSIRRVPLSSTDIEILESLKKIQVSIVESLGFENKYDLVFYHPFLFHGVPHSTTINNHLALILKQLDIQPIITSKGARHTYGSVLLAKDYSMDVVAKILGHKDVMMLIRVYGHTLDESISKQIESIKKLFE